MAKSIKLKQGLDIAIDGCASLVVGSTMKSDVFAVIPDHFAGITPKMAVKEGDTVKAGAPLFYNKKNQDMLFTSPVSGTVLGINRGERRKIMSITIQPDATCEYEKFDINNLDSITAEEVKALLLKSGLWALIKQRPYDCIANPENTPKAIFVSSFDSAPLAPNYEFVLKGKNADLQAGITALSKLIGAPVQLGIKSGSKSVDFRMLQNAEITEFDGAHPAGNVGIQIHHLNAVNQGETVWTVNIQDVVIIGRLFAKGIVDMRKLIALTGPAARNPEYYNFTYGENITNLLNGNAHKEIPLRYIEGNVLSGTQLDANGVPSPYCNQITVLAEGCDEHEFLGWGMPRFNKFSVSNTYFTNIFRKVLPKKKYEYDARLLGGRRAIIMSGEYDKVLPMDIYAEFLIKAMIAGNIDKMEQLGAYEIAPEDVALCEFVCTSKMPLQAIVRKALDNMKSELE